jgi:hypothetical protein
MRLTLKAWRVAAGNEKEPIRQGENPIGSFNRMYLLSSNLLLVCDEGEPQAQYRFSN